MKIAFFVHCFFPNHFYGTEAYTFDLAHHYLAAGHEVVVVSATFQGETATEALITHYEYQGIPVVCIDKNFIPHTRVKETYYQADMRPVLEKVLSEIKPDLVHVTHLINHTAALLEVTQQMGIKAYATFTDFFGFCLNNKLEAADGSLCSGPSVSRTNCLTCYIKEASHNPDANTWMQLASTSPRARLVAEVANLIRRLPKIRGGRLDGLIEDIVQRPETLVTLYNSAFTAAIAPTHFLGRAYKTNGVRVPIHNIWFGIDIDRSPKPQRHAGHRPVVGFIGQIAPHKGIDLLVDAFTRLPRHTAELRIYGPLDQDGAYVARLKRSANGHDIHFLGTFPRDQMSAVMREIDLLVIPSRWYENSPLVLLNALATHTPVLVSDVIGMTEFLVPGENGECFTRGDVNSLERKMQDLLNKDGRLYLMSKNTFYKRTSLEMAKKTFEIYECNL